MNNSLSSLIIDNMVHEYYVNGIRVTRGYAGRHAVSLSARVFRRLITLIKIAGNPYKRYENLLHKDRIKGRRKKTLHWTYTANNCMRRCNYMHHYEPSEWKRKYLSLFSVRK